MGRTGGRAQVETSGPGWGQAVLRNLGCISRDDGESLEGFKQEDDMIRSVFWEDCSEASWG